MLHWAWIVGASLVVAMLARLLGLVVALPVLGHGTWRLRVVAPEAPPDERRGAPPKAPGTRYSAAVIAVTDGPGTRPDSLPLPSGSSWRWTEPSKWAPLSMAMVLWMMSPSQRAEVEGAP